jgi:hypothetical protein
LIGVISLRRFFRQGRYIPRFFLKKKACSSERKLIFSVECIFEKENMAFLGKFDFLSRY